MDHMPGASIDASPIILSFTGLLSIEPLSTIAESELVNDLSTVFSYHL
jgi:hypothetical protein